MPLKTLAPFAAALAAGAGPAVAADAEKDRAAIAALDTAYQAAVERNDADAMAAILHEEMILVVGAGTIYTGADLIRAAREQDVVYARQVEDKGTQTVRLYGADTAIVTARLWLKGESKGQKFDKRLWFSDTYVRTADGWKYAFGQSSIALPDAAAP
jgi:uncharacterized protein (TIGR02246 family)